MASDAVHTEQGVLSAEDALRFLDEASGVLAGSLNYETTLRHIAQLMVPTLADWCGVDVIGDDGALRQITSGHSDPEQEQLLVDLRRRYREEKGGSEGVLRVIATGRPELFSDVRGAAGARVEILDREAELYDRLSPKSYLIVPLVARGRTLGAMTLLSTRPGRHYNEADLAFARHLARRFALAVDNSRLYDEAENARSILDNLFTTAPVGLALVDMEARFVRVNEALASLNGAPAADHLGKTLTEVVGSEGEAFMPLIRRVLDEGDSLIDLELSGRSPARPGEMSYFLASYTPVRSSDGVVIGASAVVIDVTERRRALEAEREAARRANFMAQAGAVLDASMAYEEVLARLARLVVPEHADWCAVSLLDEDGQLRQVAVVHADPAKTQLARALTERYPPAIDPERGVGKVLATGEPEVVNDVTDELLRQVAVDDEHLRILRELGLSAGVTAPLVARGRILGAISFISAESARRYEDADVQLLVELGRRAGVAVENARLYTERSRIAHTLQARLLPSRLPEAPGMRLAARYRAAGEFNEVGGDFYDAFQRAPDEWVVLIGDVSGKGPEAAALTALARYTIRSAALNDWSPAHVLRRLNDTLLHEEESQFITVALAYLRRADDDRLRVKLVLGGHPLPCVVRADGAAELVGEPGTLLGIRTDVRLHETETMLEPGDALLFYTDGVIEAGPRGAPLGEDGLVELLRGLGDADPEQLVAAVDLAASEISGGRARDDVALLAIQARVGVPAPAVVECSVPATAEHLRELRELAVVEAAAAGVDVDAVRLAVGEACANVVVHAYRKANGPGQIHLRVMRVDEGVVVEVRDDGCGPAPRSDSPGLGLGVPLMARLSRELQILDRDPEGTLVRLTF